VTSPAACDAAAVSVCMATYNGAAYLRVQIDSILSQLRAGDELVVSDDGSTDATLEILRSYGSRLNIVGTSRIAGVVPNFARALAHASRPLIMLADQDDAWLPGRVAAMTAELTHCELVVANALVVDDNLTPTGVTLFEQLPPRTGFWPNLWKNSFVGCCMAFRRSLLQRAMPMPAHTPWHDWLLGLLACLQGDGVRHLQTPMLLYRRHSSNASATGQTSKNSFRQKLSLRTHMLRALWVCRQRARSIPA